MSLSLNPQIEDNGEEILVELTIDANWNILNVGYLYLLYNR